MKQTLHTFFEKTAYSRDASDFLLRYHAIDPQRFLLMIPVLRSAEELSDFLVELRYLMKLELYPTLLLCSQYLSEAHSEVITESFGAESSRLQVRCCEEGSWLESLLELQDEHRFYKVMWTGGALKDSYGNVQNRVYLSHSKVEFSRASLGVLAWGATFLEHCGPSQSIQLVKPDQILPELFTQNGVGTLLSLGYRIDERRISKPVVGLLSSLFERAFGRRLVPGYFEALAPDSMVLLEEQGRGAIVVEPWGKLLYLDKVVVEPSFFGQGLGSLLLEELTQKLEDFSGCEPQLCWRARPDNPYLVRYAKMVQGFSKRLPMACGTVADGDYVYHFIGLKGAELDTALDKMRNRASSFSS